MILRYFYDEQLAQASYLVGCAKTGEALVLDPARQIEPYLATAAQEGLRITHVTETHIHADFVSGSRELAAATGAALYLSDMGDADWKYGFADEANVILVRDGDRWMVGNVRIEVLHTPGHTPEHIAFVLTDTVTADQPMGVFTGDFLFAGDIGRPDLLEEAAGLVGTKVAGARRMFQTVKQFKSLPDYLQIWPGHGAGSACGKALGAVPSTTLGYEKRFNPAFQFTEEAPFVDWLLADQPEAPRYFAQMKKVNKVGPHLLRELPPPQALERAALTAALKAGHLVVDLRSAEAYARAHLPGVLSIPANHRTFSTYVGWFVDYERPLYLIIPSLDELPALLSALRAIGVDHIPGFFTPAVVMEEDAQLPIISLQALAERLPRNGLTVLDVRGRSEYRAGHIVGARN
ncbi:MAG TPA: MBL fold metallo-hydrolase, partial [Caldilineaceae bacterium]|nr:MBL fold metallo-hydrolase [Caldilineaceae bacterium]